MRSRLRESSFEEGAGLLSPRPGAESGPPSAAEVTQLVDRETAGPGEPLPHLGALEAHFGRSLGHLHFYPGRADLCRRFRAKAFSVKGKVVAPGSGLSMDALRHEVTHCLQFESGPAPAQGVSPQSSSAEGQARANAGGAAGGVDAAPDAVVARDPLDDAFGDVSGADRPNYVELPKPKPRPSAKALIRARADLAEDGPIWSEADPAAIPSEALQTALRELDAKGGDLLRELGLRHHALDSAIDKARRALTSYEDALMASGAAEWVVSEDFVGNKANDDETRATKSLLARAEARRDAHADAILALSMTGSAAGSGGSAAVAGHVKDLRASLATAAELKADATHAMNGVASPEYAAKVGKRLSAVDPLLLSEITHAVGAAAAAKGPDKEEAGSGKKKAKKEADEKEEARRRGRRYECLVALLEAAGLPLVEYMPYLEALGDSSDAAFTASLIGLEAVAKDVLDAFEGTDDATRVLVKLLETNDRDTKTYAKRRPKGRSRIKHPAIQLAASDMDRLAENTIVFGQSLQRARRADELAAETSGASAGDHFRARAAAAFAVVDSTPSHADFLREHLPDATLASTVGTLLSDMRAAVKSKTALCSRPSTNPSAGLDKDPAVARKQLESALAEQDKAVGAALEDLTSKMIVPEGTPIAPSAVELFRKSYAVYEEGAKASNVMDVGKAASDAALESLEFARGYATKLTKEAVKDTTRASSVVVAQSFLTRTERATSLLKQGAPFLEAVMIIKSAATMLDPKASRLAKADAAVDVAAGSVTLAANVAAGGAATGLGAPVAALVLYFKMLNASFARLAALDALNRASRQRDMLRMLAGAGADAAECVEMVRKLVLGEDDPSQGLIMEYVSRARIKFFNIMSACKADESTVGMGIHWSGWTHQQQYLRGVLEAGGVHLLAQSGLKTQALLQGHEKAFAAIRRVTDTLLSWIEAYLAENGSKKDKKDKK